ncbi:hypothetical protein DH2020_026731 [Rehmannia glutinosa]|uniref:DUF4283 domain-containing protein n=1 Tax=Rehmannia glutinosa TaxID=99300 RepID=A0ABR0VYY0_REHGL
MKKTFSLIWPVKEAFVTRELGFNFFQFIFAYVADMEKIRDGKSWNFDNKYLILKDWEENLNGDSECFNLVDLWVQIWNIPHNWLCAEVGLKIGKSFHRVKDVLIPESGGIRGRYLKILASVELCKPLLRCAIIQLGNKEVRVDFKYEKLLSDCFYCGKVGHLDKMYDKRKVDIGNEYLKEGQFGEWIKVDDSPIGFKMNRGSPTKKTVVEDPQKVNKIGQSNVLSMKPGIETEEKGACSSSSKGLISSNPIDLEVIRNHDTGKKHLESDGVCRSGVEQIANEVIPVSLEGRGIVSGANTKFGSVQYCEESELASEMEVGGLDMNLIKKEAICKNKSRKPLSEVTNMAFEGLGGISIPKREVKIRGGFRKRGERGENSGFKEDDKENKSYKRGRNLGVDQLGGAIKDDASVDQSKVVLDILNAYKNFSGQLVNLDKSSIFFSKNVSVGDQSAICQCFGGINPQKFSRYLGLPLAIGRSKKDVFKVGYVVPVPGLFCVVWACVIYTGPTQQLQGDLPDGRCRHGGGLQDLTQRRAADVRGLQPREAADGDLPSGVRRAGRGVGRRVLDGAAGVARRRRMDRLGCGGCGDVKGLEDG